MGTRKSKEEIYFGSRKLTVMIPTTSCKEMISHAAERLREDCETLFHKGHGAAQVRLKNYREHSGGIEIVYEIIEGTSRAKVGAL